jgi:hypothetical protein
VSLTKHREQKSSHGWEYVARWVVLTCDGIVFATGEPCPERIQAGTVKEAEQRARGLVWQLRYGQSTAAHRFDYCRQHRITGG